MALKHIMDHFDDLPDPREANGRHLLPDIIVIVICASIWFKSQPWTPRTPVRHGG
jgi:hypothetical protein